MDRALDTDGPETHEAADDRTQWYGPMRLFEPHP